ncbi:MAG: Maf family protein [Erysipelotrichaceae bacterium]
MKRIILASESPRRREILASTDFNFIAKGSTCEEFIDLNLPIGKAVEDVALKKAQNVQESFLGDVILGADTVVVIDDEVLGKPKDDEDAFNMLKKLSGKTHKVITGVAILSENKRDLFHVVSEVTFFDLDDDLINWYVGTSEPMDKAGSYAIQGKGALLVKAIKGDYFNIVGLPISSVYRKIMPYIALD